MIGAPKSKLPGSQNIEHMDVLHSTVAAERLVARALLIISSSGCHSDMGAQVTDAKAVDDIENVAVLVAVVLSVPMAESVKPFDDVRDVRLLVKLHDIDAAELEDKRLVLEGVKVNNIVLKRE